MNLDSLRAEAAHHGWLKVLTARSVARCLQLARVELFNIRATPIDPERPLPPLPGGIEIRRLTDADLQAMAADPRYDTSSSFVRRVQASGDVGFGAFAGDQLVAYVWRTLTRAPHVDDMSVCVNKPYSYIYKAYTLPAYRGQRLCPSIVLRSDPWFMKRGYTHRNTFIHVCNLASLSTARSMGSRFLGFAGYMAWGRTRRFFRTPAVRRIGFRFIDAAVPAAD